jgi:hypothetical protein
VGACLLQSKAQQDFFFDFFFQMAVGLHVITERVLQLTRGSFCARRCLQIQEKNLGVLMQ